MNTTTERAEIVGHEVDAILTRLAAEDIPHSLDDTGGGCLCVRVDLADGAWIWISDDDGTRTAGRYADEDDETGVEITIGDTLDDMVRVIRTHLPAN